MDADQFFFATINGEKMNFHPKFDQQLTTRIWDNYFKRINRFLRAVPKNRRDEMILELKSHLYESFKTEDNGEEPDKLMGAIEKNRRARGFSKTYYCR